MEQPVNPLLLPAQMEPLGMASCAVGVEDMNPKKVFRLWRQEITGCSMPFTTVMVLRCHVLRWL